MHYKYMIFISEKEAETATRVYRKQKNKTMILSTIHTNQFEHIDLIPKRHFLRVIF